MKFKAEDRVIVENRQSGFHGLRGQVVEASTQYGILRYRVRLDQPPISALPLLFRPEELRLDKAAPDA